MVARVGVHALIMAFLLLSVVMHAEGPATSMAFQTKITVKSTENNTVIVKIIYLNLSYYSKPDLNAAAEPPNPNKETTTQSISYNAVPLANASLYFFFEGKNVSSDGSSQSCAPVNASGGGYANCTITHYYNGSAFRAIDSRGSCGMAAVVFRGGSQGDKYFKPSNEDFLICPANGGAISALGPALMSSLSSPANLPFCFPAIIIAGLLVSSMYYGGRDPLSLFDLTTPRLPKTKQGRVNAGSTAMSVRTAAARYIQSKKKAQKNVEKLLMKTARKNGMDSKEAKKEAKQFFKELQKKLGESINKGKSEAELENMLDIHRAELLQKFRKYGLDNSEKNRMMRKYFEKAQADFQVFYTSEVAMRVMQTARSPYGGRLNKWLNAKQQKLTEGIDSMEAKFLKLPLPKVLLSLPMVGFVAVPRKIVDSVAQYRSAKGWIRGTRRKMVGHLASKVLTKEDAESGERKSRVAGKAFEKFMEGSGLGKMAKWMYGWDYQKYVENHSVLTKRIGHLRNEENKYAWDVAEMMGMSPHLLNGLMNPDAETTELLNRLDKPKTAEEKRKAAEFMKISQLINELNSHYEQHSLDHAGNALEAKKKLAAALGEIPGLQGFTAQEKAKLKAHIETLSAYAQHKDSDLHVLFGELAKAKGMYDPAMKQQLDRLEAIEKTLREKFGLMKMREGLLKFGRYDVFDKGKLGDMTREALDAVHQHDVQIAKRAGKGDSADKIARELHMDPSEVRARLAWISSKGMGKKLQGDMSADDFEKYYNDGSVRDAAASRLKRTLDEQLGSCEAVKDALNAKGARFLLNIGDGRELAKGDSAEALFNENIGRKLQAAIVAELNREIDADGRRVNGGALSQLKTELQSLSRMVAVKSGMGDSLAEISVAADPAGSVLAYHFRQICEKLHLDSKDTKFDEIKSISDFELLFKKGIKRTQLSEELTRAFEAEAAKGTANVSRLAKQMADILRLDGTSAEHAEQRKLIENTLIAIAANRQSIRDRLNAIHGTAQYEKVCEHLGLGQQLKAGVPHAALDNALLERMSLLEGRGAKLSTTRHEINAVKKILGVSDKAIENSSYTDFVFVKMMQKTENTLSKWGGEILRSGDLMYGGASGWLTPRSLSGTRAEFSKELKLEWQVEYAASRKAMLYNQYQGESSQHIETLLYVSRAMNRGAEFAISKNLGLNAAGSMLGAFDSQLDHTLQSYAMQRAMYKNLVDKESRFYDKKFADQVAAAKKNAGGNIEDYDAVASLAMKGRGFLFMDAKRGMAFIQTADNMGVVPVMEYNKEQLNRYWDGKARGVIVKGGKEDMRDYGALLSSLHVSDFGSEVLGIVAAKNRNKDAAGEADFVRVNPHEVRSVQQLFEASKANINQRSNLAKIIAGVGVEGGGGNTVDGKPLMHFVNAADYVKYHAPAKMRAYQNVMSKAGEMVYDTFYDDTVRFRSWYAAQTRARQALERQGKMSENWVDVGAKRLDANKFFEGHAEDQNISEFRRVLDRIEQAKPGVADTLRNAVAALAATDKSADFYKRIVANIDKTSSELQSVSYGAKITADALKKMQGAGVITDAEYKTLAAYAKASQKQFDAQFKASKKEHADFTAAVIGTIGSHDNTYYGSGRSMLTMLSPLKDFKYEQSYILGFGMSIESSAMRDASYNRGGRRGADAFEKMNMNTGQGIYENQRWWATSLYEQQMVLPMAFSLWVHTALLPFASHSYRKMLGLSSYLQRTELETEWGKPQFQFLSFFGLKRGVNDVMSASTQMLSDYSGAGVAMAALRKGGKVNVAQDGTVTLERSGLANKLDTVGVESAHTFGDTQLRSQNRLMDRWNAYVGTHGDKVVKDGEDRVYVTPTGEFVTDPASVDKEHDKPLKVKDLIKPYVIAQDKVSATNDPSAIAELEKYERWLKPFGTIKMEDDRQESTITWEGGGHYFNIDGSRARPMNLFIVDHVNTWQQVIPGMTEYGPWMSKRTSTTTVNYFEHWGTTYGKVPQAASLNMLKNGYYYNNYDENTDIYSRSKSYDTHRDAYRDVFRMETPAAMSVLKMQGYAMMYDGVEPIIGMLSTLVPSFYGGRFMSLRSRHAQVASSHWHDAGEEARISDHLARFGIGDGSTGYGVLQENLNFKYAGYNELAMAGGSRNAAQRAKDRIWDNFTHRNDILALQSDEHRRNMREYMRMQLLSEQL
ncbi:MAG: hypothetical protein WCT52_00100 [Candidatus Micrarchaeia archaeon]